MLSSCHIMAHTTDWVWSVEVSLTHSLCMGPDPPKFTQVPWERGVSKGKMHGYNIPKRVWPLGEDNAKKILLVFVLHLSFGFLKEKSHTCAMTYVLHLPSTAPLTSELSSKARLTFACITGYARTPPLMTYARAF